MFIFMQFFNLGLAWHSWPVHSTMTSKEVRTPCVIRTVYGETISYCRRESTRQSQEGGECAKLLYHTSPPVSVKDGAQQEISKHNARRVLVNGGCTFTAHDFVSWGPGKTSRDYTNHYHTGAHLRFLRSMQSFSCGCNKPTIKNSTVTTAAATTTTATAATTTATRVKRNTQTTPTMVTTPTITSRTTTSSTTNTTTITGTTSTPPTSSIATTTTTVSPTPTAAATATTTTTVSPTTTTAATATTTTTVSPTTTTAATATTTTTVSPSTTTAATATTTTIRPPIIRRTDTTITTNATTLASTKSTTRIASTITTNATTIASTRSTTSIASTITTNATTIASTRSSTRIASTTTTAKTTTTTITTISAGPTTAEDIGSRSKAELRMYIDVKMPSTMTLKDIYDSPYPFILYATRAIADVFSEVNEEDIVRVTVSPLAQGNPSTSGRPTLRRRLGSGSLVIDYVIHVANRAKRQIQEITSKIDPEFFEKYKDVLSDILDENDEEYFISRAYMKEPPRFGNRYFRIRETSASATTAAPATRPVVEASALVFDPGYTSLDMGVVLGLTTGFFVFTAVCAFIGFKTNLCRSSSDAAHFPADVEAAFANDKCCFQASPGPSLDYDDLFRRFELPLFRRQPRLKVENRWREFSEYCCYLCELQSPGEHSRHGELKKTTLREHQHEFTLRGRCEHQHAIQKNTQLDHQHEFTSRGRCDHKHELKQIGTQTRQHELKPAGLRDHQHESKQTGMRAHQGELRRTTLPDQQCEFKSTGRPDHQSELKKNTLPNHQHELKPTSRRDHQRESKQIGTRAHQSKLEKTTPKNHQREWKPTGRPDAQHELTKTTPPDQQQELTPRGHRDHQHELKRTTPPDQQHDLTPMGHRDHQYEFKRSLFARSST